MATAFPYQLTFVGRLCLSFRKKTAFLPPGHSCKEIRNASSHLKDGEYWIALKKNGSLLKVYCDMTTDGGKEGTFKKTNNDNGVFLLLHILSFYNKWNVKLFCLIKNFISFNLIPFLFFQEAGFWSPTLSSTTYPRYCFHANHHTMK